MAAAIAAIAATRKTFEVLNPDWSARGSSVGGYVNSVMEIVKSMGNQSIWELDDDIIQLIIYNYIGRILLDLFPGDDSISLRILLEPNKINEWIKVFTHVSKDINNNYEYYETIGDVQLDTTLYQYLHKNFPTITKPSQLTLQSNSHNSNTRQAELAKHLGFDKMLNADCDISISMMGDVFEAFFGCLSILCDDYLAFGMGSVYSFNLFTVFYDGVVVGLNLKKDAPTRFKEIFDKLGARCPQPAVKKNGSVYTISYSGAIIAKITSDKLQSEIKHQLYEMALEGLNTISNINLETAIIVQEKRNSTNNAEIKRQTLRVNAAIGMINGKLLEKDPNSRIEGFTIDPIETKKKEACMKEGKELFNFVVNLMIVNTRPDGTEIRLPKSYAGASGIDPDSAKIASMKLFADKNNVG